MRITYLFDRPLPANETDSEQAMHTIAALARAGADLTLVLPTRPGTAVDAERIREHYVVRGEFRIVGVPQPLFGLADARKWWHALFARKEARGADVLYTRNFPTLFAAATADQPYCYETYRPWFDTFRPLAPAFRAALTRPRALGAVLHSAYAVERYASIGIPRAGLEVVHNGYDPTLIDAAPADPRAELGLPRDRPIVAYTGHVNATKGIETILTLAERTPDALFLLVGHDGKGGLIELLARRVPNVQLVRWQPFARVAYYLKAADVLLLPPSDRGLALIGNTVLPMKLFQYLAAAKPILAPHTPDLVELLRDGENARLVTAGDLDGATRALRELLHDRSVRESLAQGALETSRGLTWDARAAKILAFLERRLRSNGVRQAAVDVDAGPRHVARSVGG
jgi:glycosyltransferase involved in cell wall biosynthesis